MKSARIICSHLKNCAGHFWPGDFPTLFRPKAGFMCRKTRKLEISKVKNQLSCLNPKGGANSLKTPGSGKVVIPTNPEKKTHQPIMCNNSGFAFPLVLAPYNKWDLNTFNVVRVFLHRFRPHPKKILYPWEDDIFHLGKIHDFTNFTLLGRFPTNYALKN